MARYGGNGLPDRFFSVVEAFQPFVEVDISSLKFGLGDTPLQHLLLEMAETHMAGPAGRVCHDHYLFHA